MNELSEQLRPYKDIIKKLTKELGFNPSEGCTTFSEMLENITKRRTIDVVGDGSHINKSQFFELSVYDQENEDNLNKKIIFSDDPQDSFVVHDEIKQKKKTYMPPVPQVDAKTIENQLQEFDKKKRQRRSANNKQKTSILSSIINKIKPK